LEPEIIAQPRDRFTSRVGFILASAGSAIGLGNIWRFPYQTGTNGGGAFVLMYLSMVFLVGVSLLLVEFSIGRHGGANAVDSYRKINRKFAWVGYLGVFTSFVILSYYSVVGGWTLYYTFQSALGKLGDLAPDQMGNFFGAFISSPSTPIFYHFLFMFLTFAIVVRGISSGIEKYNKILMPALFIILIVLVIRALTLPGAMKGVAWYLMPDVSKLTGGALVSAMGQAFFSLSLGLSVMVTYASYLSRGENLIRSAVTVAVADTSVAFLAGLVVFPVLFAFGGEPAGGPGLVFVSLPAIFAKMPFGSFFATVFFLLVAVAALTSSISMMEVAVTYFVERWKLSRMKMSLIYCAVCFLLGIPASYSFGIWKGIHFFGMGIFDLLDYFVSNVSLPLCGLACTVLAGWFWKRKDVLDEVTNNGTLDFSLSNVWYGLVRYVIPVVVAVIFLNAVGILKF
jgi:NSS family neurotransmitter:Na+ symporter